MFGIGGAEFVIIALVALFIFGPERLPGAVKSAAKMLHDVRRWTTKARADLTDTLGPEFENFDLADLNPKRFVQKHLLEGLDDVDEDEVERRRAARRAAAAAGTTEPEPVGATALGAIADPATSDGASGLSGDIALGGGAVRVDTLALTESALAHPAETGSAVTVDAEITDLEHSSGEAVSATDQPSRRATPHVDLDAT